MAKAICRSIQVERIVNHKSKIVNRLCFYWADTKKRIGCVGCTTIDGARKWAEENIPCEVDFSQWFKSITE